MYPLMGSLKGSVRIAKGFRGLRLNPKGPSTSIVCTLGAQIPLNGYYNGTWTLWVSTVQPKHILLGYKDNQGVIANYFLQGLGSQVNIISLLCRSARTLHSNWGSFLHVPLASWIPTGHARPEAVRVDCFAFMPSSSWPIDPKP